MPIGLGARDSLRLEAGLCLYGHDIDETTTPIEADLIWTISKRRRAEGGFPGDAVVQRAARPGARSPPRRHPAGRPGPGARRHGNSGPAGRRSAAITSGGFGPSADRPVAMGYVDAAYAVVGTPVT